MQILILSPNFDVVSILDVFDSLIWTERYYGYGDFEIYTPTNDIVLNTLQQDSYLWSKDSDRVMIIDEIQINSDVESGDHTIITGKSLESLLDRRILWKQTILTGNLQNGIKKLLDDNVISPTDSTRKDPNFIFQISTDPSITELTISAQIEVGVSLYDAIQAICEANSIGFKIILDDNKKLIFSLYNGIDRSYSQTTNPYVIFSPNFDNLTNSSYVESKKIFKTVTLVGGEGEGDAKKFATIAAESGSGSGWSRREIYTDASGLSSNVNGSTLTPAEYTAQLIQKGLETLANNIVVRSFEGQIDSTRMFKYGIDFSIGDIVQVANEYGLESRSRVVEFIRSQDSSGEETYPTFSTI